MDEYERWIPEWGSRESSRMDIKQFLDKRGVVYKVLPHSRTHSAAEVAAAVHTQPRQVAKTVMLHADHGFRDLVAIVPADARIDLEKVGRMIGGAEIRLATEQNVAVRCPDCEPGVLPPFGSEYGMLTLVDESLAGQEEIVIEGNSRTEALQLRWEDFRRLENPLVGGFAIRE
jgi:Ala-tRNA(Pro) deacylase